MDNAGTLDILKKLEQGEITAREADEKLAPKVERVAEPPTEKTRAPEWMRRPWLYPFAAGMLGVGIGAWIIASTVNANALWFACGLPVVLLSSFVLVFAAAMQASYWIYIRVQSQGQRQRHQVNFAIPFPFGFALVALGIARRLKPNLRARMNVETSRVQFAAQWEKAEAFFDAIERELKQGRGVSVDIEDGDERVQVYIV